MSDKISEEAVPVQELKPTTTLSIHRLLKTVLVMSLSLLCIVGGFLLYQLSLDDIETMPATRKNVQSINHLSSLRRESPLLKQEKKPAFTELPKVKSEGNIELKSTAPVVVKEDKPVEKPVVADQKEVVPVVDKPSVEVLPKNDEVKDEKAIETVAVIDLNPAPAAVEPVPVVDEKYVALGKALRLRDQLRSGESCLDSFQTILKGRLPDEKQRDALTERLVPICTVSSAFQKLNDLFLRNKKEALVTYYRNTSDNRYVAYLKAAMTTLVDIRRLNPVKRKPKDIISLAQNALNMHDVAQALGYIQTLPDEIQVNFQEFSFLARAYLLAQEATDELILSFEKKGK